MLDVIRNLSNLSIISIEPVYTDLTYSSPHEIPLSIYTPIKNSFVEKNDTKCLFWRSNTNTF
jgi:hypothetical protein